MQPSMSAAPSELSAAQLAEQQFNVCERIGHPPSPCFCQAVREQSVTMRSRQHRHHALVTTAAQFFCSIGGTIQSMASSSPTACPRASRKLPPLCAAAPFVCCRKSSSPLQASEMIIAVRRTASCGTTAALLRLTLGEGRGAGPQLDGADVPSEHIESHMFPGSNVLWSVWLTCSAAPPALPYLQIGQQGQVRSRGLMLIQ